MGAKIEEVRSELKRIAEENGYDCVGFEMDREGGRNILRVFIDMPGGIDLNDCETVSRAAAEYLDSVEDSLPDGYYLEVSSLGMERPLFCVSDYEAQLGKKIFLKLKNGKKTEAIINSVKNNMIYVTDKSGETREIAFADIKSAHLVYEEQTGQKKSFKKTSKKKK